MESTRNVGAEIVNHGQIDRMTFPQGWVAGEPAPNPGIGSRSFREVYRSDDRDSSMCFFYRGLPVNDQAAQTFRAVLSVPAHELTQAEIEPLSEILRFKTPVKSEQFTMTSARTEDLNGKLVLIVEGRYTGGAEQIYEIYVDADGSGRFVQEIYFQAPKEQYERHFKEASDAINSIRWK